MTSKDLCDPPAKRQRSESEHLECIIRFVKALRTELVKPADQTSWNTLLKAAGHT